MNVKLVKVGPVPLWMALLPIVVLISMLVINVRLYGDNASYGPNQIALLISAAVGAVLALCIRLKLTDLLEGIIRSLESSMIAMLLLLLIGSLTGTWMISGVVPAMIYYGLDLLDARIFLAASVVICAIVSVATGSSWSTIATVGVALLGVGEALGVNPAMAAGAIISGAYFGDKLSPLSDTTNLASAMAGAELFEHIRYMLWTTVPSILIALGVFTAIGFLGAAPDSEPNTELLKKAISDEFNITPWLFLVPAAVLLLVILRVHALAALFVGVLLGGVFACIFQPAMIESVSGQPLAVVDENGERSGGSHYALHCYSAVVMSMAEETQAISGDQLLERARQATGNPNLSQAEFDGLVGDPAALQKYPVLDSQVSAAGLMKGKGMVGMLNTIWLIVTAMCFGGVMESSGFLARITRPLVKLARGEGSLIATTSGTCIFFNATASDQYLAIVVPGQMFRETYQERGLQPKVLSRTLEDSGTVTSVLIPWNTCGAAQQGVLGVSVLAFAPWCLFNIISPIMTMLYGFLGIGIARTQAKPPPSDTPES